MYQTILNQAKNSNVTRMTSERRHLSYLRIKRAVRDIFVPRNSTVPYSHVCQAGDPVLRAETQSIEPEIITSPPFQRVLQHMTSVMRTYKAMGLSAVQIGLPYKIFIAEVTENHLEGFDEITRKTLQIELIPLQVFINPKMKIVDYTTVKHTEECVSILGYSADVPRAKTVQIDALNASGQPFVWSADGWSARIAQHEMDHLQGKMLTDRMDPSTFSCKHWGVINARKGYAMLQYYPRSWLRRYF